MMQFVKDYMADKGNPNQAYARIRQFIGISGIAIPIFCIINSLWIKCPNQLMQPSISHYYYTAIGDLFSGILFLLGVFLLFYKSSFRVEKYRRMENRLTNAAGLFAWLVALIPTNPSGGSCLFIKHETAYEAIYGKLMYVHFGAAALMIFIFGIISYFYFPCNSESTEVDSDHTFFYRSCAMTIFVSLAILLVYFILGERLFGLEHYLPVTFTFETTAISAFALSWLKKGRADAALMKTLLDALQKTP